MDRPASCQRTYTFRLAGPAGAVDSAWRKCLWTTHEAVNRGGRIFGDWLLTLRGGLCHTLAETPRNPGHARSRTSHSARQATRQRVLLALSWLSVESRHGAPLDFAVPADESGNPGTSAALAGILGARGLAQANIDEWLEDCAPAINAQIRDDAVWINRSAMFDALVAGENFKAAREDCRQVLWNLFTDQYLVLPLQTGKSAAGESVAEQASWRAGSSGAGQRTRHLFSHLFGSSATFGTQNEKLRLRSFWSERLSSEMVRSGMRVDEAPKRGRKRLDDVNRSPSEFHREMFAKAAMRLAQTVTKIRRQEANRLRWSEADQKLHELEVQFPVALECLEQYRQANPNQPIGAEALYSCREWLIRNAGARPQATRAAAAGLGATGLNDTADAGNSNVALLADDTPVGDDPARYNAFNIFWFKGGSASRDKLKAYTEGTTARIGASQLKAVSYRHPDPYFSPIFCQFGVSRPTIDFERLSIRSAGEVADPRGVRLLLWDGAQATIQTLRAISKRFDAEIGSADEALAGPAPQLAVARRTMLSAAASAASAPAETPDRHALPAGGLRVDHVFDSAPVVLRRKSQRKSSGAAEGKTRAPRWNGTLRADRASLARLGRRAAHDPQKAAQLIEQGLEWSLGVSLDLVPHGPWIQYGHEHGLHDTRFESPTGERQIVTSVSGKNEQWRGLAYPFWHPANRATSRKGKAKQLLADLPNLRVLSVIPGHEHGAACAVWQTLSAAQFELECERAIAAGGSVEVKPLWATIRFAAPQPSADGKAPGGPRTICYRRTAADVREDGTSHATCWARLERQFLIKLPGEQDDCRRPTAAERAAVRDLEIALGVCPSPAPSSTAGNINTAGNVTQLMTYALELLAQSLKRHTQIARIAKALATDPAGLLGEGAAGGMAQAIGLWHAMAFSPTWPDAWARELWQQHLAGLPVEGLHDAAGHDRQSRLPRALGEQIARRLSALDRNVLRQKWASRWAADDGRPAHSRSAAAGSGATAGLPSSVLKPVETLLDKPATAPTLGGLLPATGWHARMRWLHDWVRGRKAGTAARGAGGLSLGRLAVLHATCEQLRAFVNRPRPDDSPAGAPAEVAVATCSMLERKLEDRAKQLASRIVEAALGAAQPAQLGSSRSASAAASCHAIVLGTPRNSQDLPAAMTGDQRVVFARTSRQLRLRLSESCQLHGLHLTSAGTRHLARQDARTAAPAIRYREVERRAFVAPGGRWSAELDEVRRRVVATWRAGRPAALADLCWLAFYQAARKDVADSRPDELLRLPDAEGPLVMSLEEQDRAGSGSSADRGITVGRGINAELNAAANLGILPLLDADWAGSWWYVPTVVGRRSQRRADPARSKGAACLEAWQAEPGADGRFSAARMAGRPLPELLQDEELETRLRGRLLAILGVEPAIDEFQADERTADESLSLAAASSDEPVPAEPARRKRGRPRKVAQVQPEFMNLWRDVSPAPLEAGSWRNYGQYNRHILARGIARLLDDSSRPGEPSRALSGARSESMTAVGSAKVPLGSRHVSAGGSPPAASEYTPSIGGPK